MKKILMRGAMNPFESYEPTEMFLHNHMGGNLGNCVYANAVVKSIFTDENIVIDNVNIKRQKIDNEYIEYVNSTYDYFLLPLSNAFRSSFIDELKKLTKFINALKIPVYLIGIGIQMGTVHKFNDTFKYPDEAREFVKAVLNHSSMVGVRGEVTADFLRHIGFKEEVDYTVIGCPSMYYYGDTLPQMKSSILTPQSTVSFNSKIEWEELNPSFCSFLNEALISHKNYVYLPQHISDIRRAYFGKEEKYEKALTKKLYTDDHVVSFTTSYDWMKYMKENVDFSVGTRIHGSIVSILSGVKSVVIPPDQRVIELCNYHEIPSFDILSVNESTTIESLFEMADYSKMFSNHKERFNHYVDFLNKLGVDNIYNNKFDINNTPFDKRVSEIKLYGTQIPYIKCSENEKEKRLFDAFDILKQDKTNVSKEKNEIIKKKNQEILKLKKEVKIKKRYEKLISVKIFNFLKKIKKKLFK